MTTVGLLLAAGAGSRMGHPKALRRDADGTSWLQRSATALAAGGCEEIVVVLGAQAEEARGLVPEGMGHVVAEDWAEGLSASLAAGLATLAEGPAELALVCPVDLVDLTPDVVERTLAAALPEGTRALVRATYDDEPGHPVVLGRRHWPGVVSRAAGDAGARGYLAAHEVVLVECGDLATGRDQDTPEPG